MSLYSELKLHDVVRVAVLVPLLWLVSSCATGIPLLDAPQAAVAIVFLAAGTDFNSGPSIRSMEICTDDSESKCDGNEYPSGSEFSVYVTYEISAALATGNYDFGLELMSMDSHQDTIELLSRRIVNIEHPGIEGASFVDLACTDEGYLAGPDAMDKGGKTTAKGARKFKIYGIAVEEQFRSSPFVIRCVSR